MIEPRNFFQARANCELYKGAGLLNLTMAETSPQNYPSKKFLQQATKTVLNNEVINILFFQRNIQFFWGTEQWIDQVTIEGDTQKNISGTIYSQRLISQCEAINSTVNVILNYMRFQINPICLGSLCKLLL